MCGGIALALFGDAGEGGAFFFRFDEAKGFAVDKEHVVGGAAFGLNFTHGHAKGGEKVEFIGVLNRPACSHKLRVDYVAGFLFWILVGRRIHDTYS